MLILNDLFKTPTDDLQSRLKCVLEALPIDALPLIKCTTQGGFVDDQPITVSVLRMTDSATTLEAKVGIFFTEAIGGCSCGDGTHSANGYGELLLIIDRQTAQVQCTVL